MFIKDHSQILKGAAQNIVYFHSINVNIDEQNHPPSLLKQYRGQQLVVAALVPPLSELLTACKVTISHNSHSSHRSDWSRVITKCCAGGAANTALPHSSTCTIARWLVQSVCNMCCIYTLSHQVLSLSASSAPTQVSPHHHNNSLHTYQSYHSSS